MKWKDYVTRFKNPGTIITLASLVILLLTTNGVTVDNERVMTTVKTVCSILVVLGIMNNTDTAGLDIPGINRNKENK